jgi:type IV secretion system protein TrbL
MNPATAFAQGVGGVMQSAFSGGTGAAVAVATGGAGAAAVIASAAGGALAAGGESAARGGGSARTTGTAINGLSGFYSGSLARKHAVAAEASATAQRQNAEASDAVASVFTEFARQQRRSRSGLDKQPHEDDPNRAAIDIESHAKLKS